MMTSELDAERRWSEHLERQVKELRSMLHDACARIHELKNEARRAKGTGE